MKFVKEVFFVSLFFLFITPTISFAHSTVSPINVLPSKYETFSVSAPSEKEVATVGIRLLIPNGLDKITPFVKPGWVIQTRKEKNELITEIEWTGGEIPAGQKDIFQFTARTPQNSTTLIWKVYQTYADGEVIAWDGDPKKKGAESQHPYSTTEVRAATSETNNDVKEVKDTDTMTKTLSLASFLLSLATLGIVWRYRKK